MKIVLVQNIQISNMEDLMKVACDLTAFYVRVWSLLKS